MPGDAPQARCRGLRATAPTIAWFANYLSRSQLGRGNTTLTNFRAVERFACKSAGNCRYGENPHQLASLRCHPRQERKPASAVHGNSRASLSTHHRGRRYRRARVSVIFTAPPLHRQAANPCGFALVPDLQGCLPNTRTRPIPFGLRGTCVQAAVMPTYSRASNVILESSSHRSSTRSASQRVAQRPRTRTPTGILEPITAV